VNFGTDRDEVTEQLVDGVPWAEVRELEQLRVGFDNGLDEPLDLFGPGIDQSVAQNVGLFDDGERLVRGTGIGVHLCRRVTQPHPRS
jgi:hypothetical protein